MRRYRGLFKPSGAFSRHQFSADYTITMFGFDFRQGQAAREFVKKLHPLAQAFPVVTGTAFEEIKASIREHGQIHAIILYEGKVFDGVTRQRILQEPGLNPRYEVLPANIDPIDYVIVANLRRRQLTPAQRALIGAKLAVLQRGDNQHPWGWWQ